MKNEIYSFHCNLNKMRITNRDRSQKFISFRTTGKGQMDAGRTSKKCPEIYQENSPCPLCCVAYATLNLLKHSNWKKSSQGKRDKGDRPI